MHKLLILGTIVGIGVGLVKLIKNKKEDTKDGSASIDMSSQPTPSAS